MSKFPKRLFVVETDVEQFTHGGCANRDATIVDIDKPVHIAEYRLVSSEWRMHKDSSRKCRDDEIPTQSEEEE
mgnify:CR=1 FL=1